MVTPSRRAGRTYRWMMKMQPLMPRRLVAMRLALAGRKIRDA